VPPSIRPSLEAQLLRLESLADDAPSGLMAQEAREVIAWAIRLETIFTPSHRHLVLEHAGHNFCYELSLAGHILWVTWHRASRKVRETQVAAVRLRTHWEPSPIAAPVELTKQALAELGV
jgi:hypothetical protein